ncbi:hypothetical protein Tco_0514017 [Tanacetum coccineum]
MRIEQYFLMTDYALWEVILNGDSPLPTRNCLMELNIIPSYYYTTKLARKNEVKGKSTMLMAFPNEEMDLKWQMAMLEIRARIFLKKIGRNLGVNGTDTIGFNKTKCDGFGYDWSDQAEEGPTNFALMAYSSSSSSSSDTEDLIKAPRNQDSRNREITRRNVPVEETTLNALVSQCDEFGYDWSDQAEEGSTNFALMANTSSISSSSDTEGNPQLELQEKGVINSGCSRHMTGNKSYLSDYEEIDGGFVAFCGNPKGSKITRKGKIRTRKLDFEDVYFVKELKFNLFSVSQMCDKKNSVLFTDTECVVLSLDFKLLDESQVLLRVPR